MKTPKEYVINLLLYQVRKTQFNKKVMYVI